MVEKSNSLKGVLIFTEKFGWQVRYEFGQNQIKNLVIHIDSIEQVKKFGIEGQEVEFLIRGTPAPRSLNKFLSSAYILNENGQ